VPGVEIALIVWLPEVALLPDQAPVAAQLEALLEDQLNSVDPPGATVFGAALSETVGAVGGPGGGMFPPLLSVPPPPQAARLQAHSNANDRP
jgi:hypothetical protein